ncbi:nucleotidyltransferase family protein [Ignatzschineria cameli]|uniref:Nucleotidyltransferase family protein n=1 Tax=Ignatzschineria cameli TaxID=2182793 RepID=A0A2U2AKD4_9GAMM|nr:nucleotidyltransferase family protein [Ignatzschineria cameli]PWD83316.1 nucleotidyltransferase family protein [Ignatzschineria cameli]PWD87707.1 nucleotidyltransferase family protein [Ignatzschineria cameli]PWD89103.1 nucleotidyltransferase family protein [Ignatzschineria cameli]PWD90033.1 nucleotidyltransferase family protein [Ignatzschineria cameli]
MTIGIFIMAAGLSRRFKAESNQHKLLVSPPLFEEALLTITYNRVKGAFKEEEIAIITNHAEPEVTALARSLHPHILTIESDGLGESIGLATKALLLADDAPFKVLEGIFILPADLPYLLTETLILLKGYLEKSEHPIIRPLFDHMPGHPVGFKSMLFPELAQLSGDLGAQKLLKPEMTRNISVFDPGVIWDIDTPEDLLTKPGDHQWYTAPYLRVNR